MDNGVAILLIPILCTSGVLYRPFESRATCDRLVRRLAEPQNSLDFMEKRISSFRSGHRTMIPRLPGP